jgi:hypothetical protein
MGMQQQSMNQMACTTMDEFDNAMQMWSMVLQGAQGCPDVEAEARAQLGALETWRNALMQTMGSAQSASPDTQQMAQNDLIQTCAKAHTAVMRAEQAFLQEYGQAQDELLSEIGMQSIMGEQTTQQFGMEQQYQQPWQQQQYQPSFQGTMGSQQFQPSYQRGMEQQPWQTSQRGMSQYGAGSQYGQQQYQPSYQRGMEQQYQPSYQREMEQQYQPSFQGSMGRQQYQPSYGMGRQQSYAQQTREPYTQAVSQVPYGQQGMSTMGETFGPYAFSRGSYYGPMGLHQYGEPVQHERIPEAGSAWRGSQMGMGGQTGMQGQGQMGGQQQQQQSRSQQSSRGSEQSRGQQSRSSQMRQRNW